MYFCTIASSSSGNCTLISEDSANILIDAGISTRRIVAALRTLGLEPFDISAILVTHEHSDHISGLQRFSRKYGIDVYAGEVTARILVERGICESSGIRAFVPGDSFEIDGIWVRSFRTPHDTPESVGYRLFGKNASFAFATDLGYMPDSVMSAISGADAVLLEANHDVRMLRSGQYPYHLKKRILGDGGHLSNETAAKCAVELVRSGTKRIVLAHLSKENNIPKLALRTVSEAVRKAGLECAVSVAPGDVLGDVCEVENAEC